MIESATKNLTELGIAEKFELVCADMFDEKFELPEKVDAVICSYVLTTFLTNYDDLKKILKQCSKCLKDDGYLFITDFSWVNQEKSNFETYGMYTKGPNENGDPPKDFEIFKFHIDKAPNDPFEIFHIPNHIMYKAGLDVGFDQCDFKMQYPDPAFADHPAMRKYIDTCDPSDYLMKFTWSN